MHPNQEALNAFHERWRQISERRRFAPNQSVEHFRAWADPSTARLRERNWITACAAVEAHVALFGMLPRSDGSRDGLGERRLANWIRYQRRSSDRLCAYQKERLQLLDGWVWEPREERWLDWLTDYETFIRQNLRRPRRSSDDAEEVRLAIWYRNQRHCLSAGRLDREREHLLGQLDVVVRKLLR